METMNLSELIKALTDAGVPECTEYPNITLDKVTGTFSGNLKWTTAESEFGKEAIYLAHLKAWLREREDYHSLNIHHSHERGPSHSSGAFFALLGMSDTKGIGKRGPTELQALAACVLEYLTAT